jgi:hypothetical protein
MVHPTGESIKAAHHLKITVTDGKAVNQKSRLPTPPEGTVTRASRREYAEAHDLAPQAASIQLALEGEPNQDGLRDLRADSMVRPKASGPPASFFPRRVCFFACVYIIGDMLADLMSEDI